ncbi:hypothetical protein [Streptomyces sp. NPDC058891]|uniref:hypothetical protein n=1 Tax=Streptomyces sp. NPDC058891 TaxID=3346667 RepID=UPI00368E3AE4
MDLVMQLRNLDLTPWQSSDHRHCEVSTTDAFVEPVHYFGPLQDIQQFAASIKTARSGASHNQVIVNGNWPVADYQHPGTTAPTLCSLARA